MTDKATRTERDTMGEVPIPEGALWGANTERARQNLPISNKRMPEAMLKALARIKASVAKAAGSEGFLPVEVTDKIQEAAQDVIAGKYTEHFPLDVFQTGSGTSSNMNMNEVIANLASVALGGKIGEYKPVNPNDHVNFGQSSNDTIPSALHLAALDLIDTELIPKLEKLIKSWEEKAEEYDSVVKTGRTHFQDALPVTFGHVFRAYAEVFSMLLESIKDTLPKLSLIPLGGTAVGTGFQAPEELPSLAAKNLSEMVGHEITAVKNPLVFMAGRPVVADVMGRIAALAGELHRIANDVRMMGSGPRLGIGEITIPALQPGSSIMPGKVNPVVCESIVQVAMAVAGYQTTVLAASAGGQFELNVTLPVTANALLGSIEITANACEVFRTRLIENMTVRVDDVGKNLNQSLALATALIAKIGYAEAAKVAYKAHNDGTTPAEAIVEMGILKADEVDAFLDPLRLTKPGRLT